MIYSQPPYQPPADPTISVIRSSSSKSHHRSFAVMASLAVIVMAGIGAGTWAWTRPQLPSPAATQSAVTSAPSLTPAPQVAGASFGDILRQANSFQGWLAGVKNGSIMITNPLTAQVRQLTQAENAWAGPISELYWSPDHTKIAALYLSTKDAVALAKDASTYMHSLGLEPVTQPTLFPYGRLTIIDVASGQATTTNLESRNMAKSVVWLDNNRLALATNTLTIYNISADSTTAIVAAGSTDLQEQLQPPLAWDSDRQLLYFIKTKTVEDQILTLLATVSVGDSQVKELTTLNAGQSNAAAAIDLALSANYDKVAVIDQSGISYIDLATQASHTISYNQSRLWLKQVSFSQVGWLDNDQLVFAAHYPDNDTSWSIWQTTQDNLMTVAKGALAGSWNKASGQLAAQDASATYTLIITPQWANPDQPAITKLAAPWQQLSW